MVWLESMGGCSPGEGVRPRVAIIGFGRRGRSLARTLLGRGFRVAVYDIAFRRPDSVPARFLRKLPVIEHASIPGVVADCILIAVTTPAEAALEVARAAAEHLEPGARYIDATGAVGAVRHKVTRALAGSGCAIFDNQHQVAASGSLHYREAAELFGSPTLDQGGMPMVSARPATVMPLSSVRPLVSAGALRGGLPRVVAA